MNHTDQNVILRKESDIIWIKQTSGLSLNDRLDLLNSLSTGNTKQDESIKGGSTVMNVK